MPLQPKDVLLGNLLVRCGGQAIEVVDDRQRRALLLDPLDVVAAQHFVERYRASSPFSTATFSQRFGPLRCIRHDRPLR